MTQLADAAAIVAATATLVLALSSLIKGMPGVRAWVEKQRDQLHQQRLSRRAILNGWSPHTNSSVAVELVTDPAERASALEELATGNPDNRTSRYVLLRLDDEHQADRLRRIVERDGYLSRIPEAGEYEAMEAGLKSLGITSRTVAMTRARGTD